jgi:hypothetical protein
MNRFDGNMFDRWKVGKVDNVVLGMDVVDIDSWIPLGRRVVVLDSGEEGRIVSLVKRKRRLFAGSEHIIRVDLDYGLTLDFSPAEVRMIEDKPANKEPIGWRIGEVEGISIVNPRAVSGSNWHFDHEPVNFDGGELIMPDKRPRKKIEPLPLPG